MPNSAHSQEIVPKSNGFGTSIFRGTKHSRCWVSGWCFVPNTYLVADDVMLAQKIALETDERAALAVAKSFSPKGGGLNTFVPP